MSENYLWDKTGSDPDTEHLENMLAVFKYEAAEPRPVMRTAVQRTGSIWRGIFSFRIALAGAAAAFAAASLIWLGSTPPLSQPLRSSSVIANGADKADPKIVNDDQLSFTTASIAPAAGRSSRKIMKHAKRTESLYVAARKPMVVEKRGQESTKPPSLTREEKAAYSTLMLALSITGSKLKLVQDTIDRIEGPDRDAK